MHLVRFEGNNERVYSRESKQHCIEDRRDEVLSPVSYGKDSLRGTVLCSPFLDIHMLSLLMSFSFSFSKRSHQIIRQRLETTFLSP